MTGVLVPTSSEADWLQARRQGITASEISVVMGLAPTSWENASPYALFYQKTGDLPAQDDNLSMAVGRHFEDFVADLFAVRRPEFWLRGDGRTLYAHPDRPWQMATPDRVVLEKPFIDTTGDVLAVLECKTDGGFDGWGDDSSDEIPVHYRCQVLWQMDVVGVTTGYVACLFMNRRQLRVYEITMNAQALMDLNLMRAEAAGFLARIELGNPPAPDWRPATGRALRRMHPLVEDTEVVARRQMSVSYRAAVRRAKAADRRKAELTNKLLQAMGSARKVLDPDGELLATRSVSEPERIDTKRLRAEYPDVARAVTKPPKPEIRLTPAKDL